MEKRRPVVVLVAFVMALAALIAVPQKAYATDSGGPVEMKRLYNPNSGEHFYTANTNEADKLVGLGWRSEGVGWYAPAKSSVPVYRLYNPNAGDHHYTTSVGEKNHLVSVGWNDEGIGWYSSETKAVPLYRQYNPNAYKRPGGSGAHNYTASKGENDHLVSVGWRAEGIGWYGLNTKAQWISIFELADDGSDSITKNPPTWPSNIETQAAGPENFMNSYYGYPAPIPSGYVPFTGTRTYSLRVPDKPYDENNPLAQEYVTKQATFEFKDGMLVNIDGLEDWQLTDLSLRPRPLGLSADSKYHFDWQNVKIGDDSWKSRGSSSYYRLWVVKQ